MYKKCKCVFVACLDKSWPLSHEWVMTIVHKAVPEEEKGILQCRRSAIIHRFVVAILAFAENLLLCLSSLQKGLVLFVLALVISCHP